MHRLLLMIVVLGSNVVKALDFECDYLEGEKIVKWKYLTFNDKNDTRILKYLRAFNKENNIPLDAASSLKIHDVQLTHEDEYQASVTLNYSYDGRYSETLLASASAYYNEEQLLVQNAQSIIRGVNSLTFDLSYGFDSDLESVVSDEVEVVFMKTIGSSRNQSSFPLVVASCLFEYKRDWCIPGQVCGI